MNQQTIPNRIDKLQFLLVVATEANNHEMVEKIRKSLGWRYSAIWNEEWKTIDKNNIEDLTLLSTAVENFMKAYPETDFSAQTHAVNEAIASFYRKKT